MRKRRKMRREKRKVPPRGEIPTTEKLAQVLEAHDDPRLHTMISKARAGYYDDYKTTIDRPIGQLVADLCHHGYNALAQRAIEGEFDAQPWEGQEWMRKEGNALILASFDREGEASNDEGT